MKYLLDTCVISEPWKSKPKQSVLDWYNDLEIDDCFISALTIGEVKHGILRMPGSKRRFQFENYWEKFLEHFSTQILDVDNKVMNEWALLQVGLEKKGKMMPAVDSIIAATAMVNNLVVVTRNVKDFDYPNLLLINPWEF